VVGVQPAGYDADAGFLDGSPGEDLRHGGGAGRVKDQAGFGSTLRGFERDGVGEPLGGVPIGRFAGVPSREGVLTQPLPGFLLDLQPVPLGHALLDPADQDGGRIDPLHVDRLVGGEQRHTAGLLRVIRAISA
jgi:hypothetical protein